MFIDDIKVQINALKEQVQSKMPVALKNRVEVAHAQRVLLKLEAIFNESPPSSIELVAFLSTNWTFAQGTMVCVTATPESPLTELLCDVAEWAAEATQQHPISLLMPTIELESVRDGYPNLSELPLKTVLKTHILGDDNLHLIPIWLLTELDLSPKPDPMRMPYVSEIRNEETAAYTITPNEYKRLAEHSSLTQSLIDARNGYLLLANDSSNLLGQLQLLCSHLAINNAYAGSSGTQANAGAGAYPAIMRFMDYYQKLGSEEAAKIPNDLKENIDTLLGHSSDPTKNVNATVQVETCIADRRSKIIAAMRGHEALLSQISLTGVSKHALIEEAKAQFEKAQQELALAINTALYSNGRDKLNITMSLLSALDVVLNVSSLPDLETIQTLSVPEIMEVLNDRRLRDRVINTLSSVENLVIFVIETSPEKAAAFLQALSSELLNRLIRNQADLSALLISLDPEKFNIVLLILGKSLIQTIDHFILVCRFVSKDQRTLVFDALKHELSNMIVSPKDLVKIEPYVSQEQRDFILSSWPNSRVNKFFFESFMLSYRPKFAKVGDNMFVPMANSELEHRRMRVLLDIKDQLPELIHSADVFGRLFVLKWSPVIGEGMREEMTAMLLFPDERMLVFDVMKEYLPRLTFSCSDFATIASCLSLEQFTIYWECMKDRLPSLIPSTYYFSEMMKPLSPEQRTMCFEHIIKPHLSEWVKTQFDAYHLCKYLTPDEKKQAYSPNWCFLSFHASYALTYQDRSYLDGSSGRSVPKLAPSELTEQRMTRLLEIKDQFPALIRSADDFGEFLERIVKECNITEELLFPDERALVFDAMKDRLPSLTESADDFAQIARPLSPKQRSIYFESMKSRLSELVKTERDARYIRAYLTSEERKQVYAPNWYFLWNVMTHPLTQGTTAVMMVAAAASVLMMQEEPLAVIQQTAIATVNMVSSTVLFFAQKNSDNTSDEVTSDRRPGT